MTLREAAAQALGFLATDDAVAALCQATREDTEPSDRVRAMAAYALGDALTAGTDEAAMERAVSGLVAATRDSVGDVRLAAIQALGKGGFVPKSNEPGSVTTGQVVEVLDAAG